MGISWDMVKIHENQPAIQDGSENRVFPQFMASLNGKNHVNQLILMYPIGPKEPIWDWFDIIDSLIKNSTQIDALCTPRLEPHPFHGLVAY